MERATCARAPAREADAQAEGPSFDDFAARWQGPLQEERARRAWQALQVAERRAAVEAVGAGWCEHWRAQQSSTVARIGAGTFLEGRRWREHGRPVAPAAADVDAQLAEMIREGKPYLVRNVSAVRGRRLLELGLVTRAELARVGLE